MKRSRKNEIEMDEARHEALTIEEIKQRLREGYQFYPTQPGLKEAARELIRPLVEGLQGREIIYVCRISWLMRVVHLQTDDDGFRAEGKWIQEIESALAVARRAERRGFQVAPELDCSIGAIGGGLLQPFRTLRFGASWTSLLMSGDAIGINMITDCFYPNPALAAEVKAAMARNASADEIFAP